MEPEHHPMGAEDYASIDRAESALRAQGWTSRLTLSSALGAWKVLIDEVGAGYQWSIDEYTNDLTVRDWLDQAWPLLSQRVRDARDPELAALDQRWRAATVDDGGAMVGRYFCVDASSGWWWRRRPRVIEGEFAEDALPGDLERPT
jgi:hypothetical protein